MGKSNHWLRRFIEVSKCRVGFSEVFDTVVLFRLNEILIRSVLPRLLAGGVSSGWQEKIKSETEIFTGVKKTFEFETILFTALSS